MEKSIIFLKDWAINFLKNKDLIFRKIVEIDEKEGVPEFLIRFKDKEQIFHVIRSLNDIPEIDKERYEILGQKIGYHHQIPRINLVITPPAKILFRDEITTVEVILENVGWGRAENVKLILDDEFLPTFIKNRELPWITHPGLEPGENRTLLGSFRINRRDEFGEIPF